MKLLELVRRGSLLGEVAADFAEAAPKAVASSSTSTPSSPAGALVSTARAERVAQHIAQSIPAVRRAQAVLAGTISTFELFGRAGDDRLPADDPRVAWLRQPDPDEALTITLGRTIRDGIWRGRAVWEVLDRALTGLPVKFRRVHPARIDTITDPLDPDRVVEWLIDGRPRSRAELVIFDFSDLGGLERYGFELLSIYGKLQTAAGRYADEPHPKAILRNSGADLTDEEIDALLDRWEQSRAERSVGYLNAVVEYETYGWSAAELQLTEAREHAALETARLFGLPAASVDASSGDSLTYSTTVEKRREILEALRPWMTVITQTLSLDDRSSRPRGRYLPYGIVAEFDADAYTRDAPTERMEMWATAITHGVLSADEVRAREPLARGLGPAPAAPAPTQEDTTP